MNTIDPQKAARVWQRVQATPEAKETGLTAMIMREWTGAAVYLQLSRRLQGKDSAMLRRLYEEKQENVACLKGIYILITGSAPVLKGVAPTERDTKNALRRRYGQEMQALADCESRCGDTEYGHVFTRLAERQKEHCRLLLTLLGK